MINANELRIGNMVKAAIKIDLADFKTPDYMAVGWMMIRDCDFYKENWAWEPIPLTPEILEGCGLKKRFDTDSCNIWDSIETQPTRGGGFSLALIKEEGWLYLTAPGAKPLHYLHQLQNLFFALTGTELLTPKHI